MSKIKIPNKPGHYEMSGAEIDVYNDEIIIRTFHQNDNRNWKKQDQRNHDQLPRKQGDDGNMSLLSSVLKLRDKFADKK